MKNNILIIVSVFLFVLLGFIFVQDRNFQLEVSNINQIIKEITNDDFLLMKSVDLNGDDKDEQIIIKQGFIEEQSWIECPQGCTGSKLYITMYSDNKIVFEDFEFVSAVTGYPYDKRGLKIYEGDVTDDGNSELVVTSQTGGEFSTTNIILGFSNLKNGILQHFEYNGDILFIKDDSLYGKFYIDDLLGNESQLRIYKWNGENFDVSDLSN